MANPVGHSHGTRNPPTTLLVGSEKDRQIHFVQVVETKPVKPLAETHTVTKVTEDGNVKPGQRTHKLHNVIPGSRR